MSSLQRGLMAMRHNWTIELVLGALAAVLLVAAALKVAALTYRSSALLEIVIAVVEAGLALFLLLSPRPSAPAFVSMLLFAAFLGHNVGRLIHETAWAPCGCFGVWEIPVLTAVLLDAACLVGAVYVVLTGQPSARVARLPRLGVFAGLAAFAFIQVPSSAQSVTAPSVVPLGIGRPHETRVVALKVTTTRPRGVVLLGAVCSRGVGVASGLPVRLSPDRPATLRFSVQWPGTNGMWRQWTTLLVDTGERVTVEFRGRTSEQTLLEVCDENGGS